MAFLCDTNVLSEALRPLPNYTVRAWLDSQEPVWISVITVEEIAFGLVAKDAQKQLAWFDSFLKARCRVLPVTATIARRTGLLRGRLRRQGIYENPGRSANRSDCAVARSDSGDAQSA